MNTGGGSINDITELSRLLAVLQGASVNFSAQATTSDEVPNFRLLPWLTRDIIPDEQATEAPDHHIISVNENTVTNDEERDDEDDGDETNDDEETGDEDDEETDHISVQNTTEQNHPTVLSPEIRSLLFQAACRGDLEKAKELFEANPAAMTAPLTPDSKTALHLAADEGQYLFVQELLNRLQTEELEITNIFGFTALHSAVFSGNCKLVEAIVDRNPNLAQMRTNDNHTPLELAVVFPCNQRKAIVELLCTVLREKYPTFFSSLLARTRTLSDLIDAGFYDIVLSLLQWLASEGTRNDHLVNCLLTLQKISERPFAFLSGSRLNWWQQLIYSVIHVDKDPPNSSGNLSTRPSFFRGLLAKLLSMTYLSQAPSIKRIYNQKVMHTEAVAIVKAVFNYRECGEYLKYAGCLKAATIYGTVEFVEGCLQAFPSLAFETINNEKLLHIAIEERNEKIFKIICDSSDTSDSLRNLELLVRYGNLSDNNTILHLVAKLAPPRQLNLVSGAALQMQREMQWFKVVENIVPEKDRLNRNNDGNTAQFIFIKEHKDLVEKAERWMKDTSQSCMVVATLIATVAFAAAFTVPGGNISDTNSNKNGTPIFLHNNFFMVFAVADALALFSSITSVLMFLAILTSRFAEEDFLKSLPQKLILGFATLFFCIATMMVAFGASLAIVLGDRLTWVPVPVGVFACVPVTLFALLQVPLFVEMVRSTYWPSIFRKSRDIGEYERAN